MLAQDSHILDNGSKIEYIGNTLYLHGEFTVSNTDKISPFLIKFHEYVIKNNIKNISLDFSKLKFINSGAIREIIDWLLLLSELKTDQKYTVHILYDAIMLWQESTVSTLVYLNPNLISKENL